MILEESSVRRESRTEFRDMLQAPVAGSWTIDEDSDPKLKPAIILVQEDSDLDHFLHKCKDDGRYLTLDEKIRALITGIIAGIASIHKGRSDPW